ncbi:hypothetical protein MUP95_09380, partial [bacterium]|nr:hypothetical protein [bacterium]
MKRPVYVKHVSINPFGEIDVRDIDIGFPENETMEEKPFFQMDRLVIHFKLLPLLRRRLDITSVLLDKPKLALVSDIPFEHMTEKTELYSETESERELEEKVSLPVSIGLFHLVLNDFRFDVTMTDLSGEKELTLSGIHLDISDLYFPRRFLEELKGARGKFRLFTQEGRVVFRNKKDLFDVAANLDVAGGVYSGDQWDLHGNIGFQTSASDDRPAVNLNIDLKGIGYGENIQVDRFDLYADQQELLHVEGVANHSGKETHLDFSFQSDPIDLKENEQTFGRYLLFASDTSLEDMDISGSLHLKNGELHGDLENMHFLYQLSLGNGNMQSRNNHLDVKNGNVHIQAEGIWTSHGLKDGTISGDLEIDQLDYVLNDTVTISTKGISLDCSSQLDSAFIPANGFARGHVDEMLDGLLDMKLDWASEENVITKAKEMVLKGQIRADSLQLASFPNPSGFSVNGRVGLVTDVNVH